MGPDIGNVPSVTDREALLAFVSEVRGLRAQGGLQELSLYPALDSLLRTLLAGRGWDHHSVVQQKRTEFGVPDFVVQAGDRPVGWVEAKRPGLSLGRLRGHDREQAESFRNLDNLLLTTYHDFRLFQDGEQVGVASLGDADVLDPDSSEPSGARLEEVADLLDRFLSRQPPAVVTTEELARTLARGTRVLRRAVSTTLTAEPAGGAVRGLRASWSELLFDDADDADFADAYAQTVAYGLLTARLEAEGPLTLDGAARTLYQRHRFLSAAFRLLTEFEVREVLGWAVDYLLALLDPVSSETFRRTRHRHDPLLYFYEDFLAEYDSRLRKSRGVYYTPASVVDFQVRAVGDLLGGLGRPRLLAEEDVVALDPATGTGTYLLALLAETRNRVVQADGDDAGVRPALARAAERAVGFELLVGPYAVAHQRVGAALEELSGEPQEVRVHLVDTLAEPHEAPTGQVSFAAGLGQRLAEERQRADAVKTSENVVVVLGNPPYSRGRGLPPEHWLQRDLLPAFTGPVAAEHTVNLKNLADPYVHFYRWALWKLFEATPFPGPRLLTFITNRSFLLDGAFGGMRKVLRQRFDELWVVDLEGESKGANKTVNVFDIQVGVCILVGVRRDALADEHDATVRYARLTGTRSEKEQALKARLADLDLVEVVGGATDPFIPPPDRTWTRWPALEAVMPTRTSGVETKRDRVVVAPTRTALARQLEALRDPVFSPPERDAAFRSTAARQVPDPLTWEPSAIRRYGYRPLSRQYLLDDFRYIDRPRPALHDVWHPGQQAFVTLPRGHGLGPALVQQSDLPDRHSFRGSFGGHVFPLWLDEEHGTPNLAPGLLGRLRERWGVPDLSGDQVFDYVYGALSAPSYTTRFRPALAQGFPRVPFPARSEDFLGLARPGARLRAAHALVVGGVAPMKVQGTLGPLTVARHERDRLLVSDHAAVTPVSDAMWTYEVSGYRVLQRWVKERAGIDLDRDYETLQELRRVAGAVRRSVELGPALDAGLAAVLEHGTIHQRHLLPADAAAEMAQWTADPGNNERLAAAVAERADLSQAALLAGES